MSVYVEGGVHVYMLECMAQRDVVVLSVSNVIST